LAPVTSPEQFWIDTYCHLDAPKFSALNQPPAPAERAQAAMKGVAYCVIPAVKVGNFNAVRKPASLLKALSAQGAVGEF
jgi:Tat protein secretion system quality control protein TatD with DNase activity